MKQVKRFLSVVLCLVMVLALVPAGNLGITASATSKTVDDAMNWCQSLVGTKVGSGECVALIQAYYSYLGASPVSGNACDYATNALPSGWSRVQGGEPTAGDILVYTGAKYGHVAIYAGGSDSYHQNMDGTKVSKRTNWPYYNSWYSSAEGGTKSYWGYIRPNFPSSSPSGHSPTVALDHLSGGEGVLNLSGWAFDEDDYSAQLSIHVYIGSGDSREGYGWIVAGKEREDVNSVHGCGKYHGFSEAIPTNLSGNQWVTIWAINVGGGDNTLIYDNTVYIDPAPILSPVIGDDKNAVSIGEEITFIYSGLRECSQVEFCIEVNGVVTQYIDSTSSTTYTTYCTVPGPFQLFVRGYYNGKWYYSEKITVTVLDPVIHDDKNTVCIGEPITFTYSGLTECSAAKFEFSKNGTVYYSPDSTSSTTFTTCFENPGTYYVNAAGYLDGNWCRSGKIKVEVVNHSYGAWTKLNDTQHQRVCSRDSSHVEKANHIWNSGTVTQAATCSATGTKTYTCTVCSATKTETVAIDSSNHVNTTNTAATASTCTVKGYTAGVYCNDCKKYISGHQEQPLAAHKTELRNQKNATCTAEGYTGDQYCTVCKQTISTGTTIGKTAHTLTTINQKNATCTTAGYTGDQYCTACKQPITKGSAISALGHTAPDGNGNCTRCGTHIKDVTPTQPTQPQPNPNACKWCGKVHNGNFFDKLVGFFHSILAIFKR